MIERMYRRIIRQLWNDGEATFSTNGRKFRLFFEDATQEVEICEFIRGEPEYLFSCLHESEIFDWLEELWDECGSSA